MPRKFSSFLIRWWLSDDIERLDLEHIQSGRKHLAGSMDDAVAWLKAQQTTDGESALPEISEINEEEQRRSR